MEEANTCSQKDGKVQYGEAGRQDDNMPIKVLIHEKNELRLRITGESHTALQILRDRLNNHKSVEYANYFPGHPDLDPPEFYIRTTGKQNLKQFSTKSSTACPTILTA